MSPLLISLGAGVVIGLLYALFKVRSPAPPAIALVGLLGMLVAGQITSQVMQKNQSSSAPVDRLRVTADLPPPPTLRTDANQAG
jgi:XapX domain-containing protein